MDETGNHTGSVRRMTAEDVNRAAQELENEATGGHEFNEIPTENRQTSDVDESAAGAPVQSSEQGYDSRVFPPDLDGNTTIGGSPEEQGVLDEEQRR